MSLSPEARRLRGRLGALAIHARGLTNTAPGTAAFLSRFERIVAERDGPLPPAELARRAEFERRRYMTELAFKRARRHRAEPT